MVKNNARNPGESGQMLILFVLGLGVLMGMVAMSVDVGMILVERRSLQNAADAGALAGVPALPPGGNAADARALARDYVEKNGYIDGVDGVKVKVQSPYNGNPKDIEVVIEKDVPFLFALALGLDSVSVSTRAVARADPSSGYGPAIFAYGTGCANPIEVVTSSANIDVVGDIISNGSVKMTGSDIQVEGSLTYICDDPLLQNGTFTGGLNQVSQPMDWPAYFDYSDFACDFAPSGPPDQPWLIDTSTPTLWLNDDPNTGVLKPGVYCHQYDIMVSASASGNVTFVSKEGVYFNGGPYNFTPFQDDVLIYGEKPASASCPYPKVPDCFEWNNSAVHISSNGFTWEGIIFAPNGIIQFSSSSVVSPSGGVWGDTVKFSASSGSITGLIDSEPSFGPVRLVE